MWKVTDACTACGTCADVCPVDPTLYVVNDVAVY
ncbi:MAG: 4Fe-4S binding protein, partial [Promethearchaeota archaeon]